MSLFGKNKEKSSKGAAVEDIGAVDEIENAGAPLSAPVKEGAKPKSGGSSRFLLFLLTIILGGLGGGYYYLNTVADEAPPAVLPQELAAATPISEPAPTAPSGAAETPATDSPAAVTATAETSLPTNSPAPMPGVESVPPQPVDDALATEQPAPPPSDMQAPTSVSEDLPPPPTLPGTPAAAVTAIDQKDEMPPTDLPLPKEESLNSLPATAATSVNVQSAPAPATDTAPTDAEKAIVDNAEIIDKVSHPSQAFNGTATGDVKAVPEQPGQLSAQPAIIRPIPETYIIVKKDHDASDVDSRIAAGRVALSQGRSAAALEIFNGLFVDYPLDKRVLMGRALAYQHAGQLDTATAAYEDVLVKDPKNLEALTNMLGLLKAQDPALAVQKLAELREIYPYNADISAQLGIAHGAKGNYADGLKYLDMAESLSPGRLDILYNRAVIYDRAGRSVDAANLYRQVLARAADQGGSGLPLDSIRNRLSVLR